MENAKAQKLLKKVYAGIEAEQLLRTEFFKEAFDLIGQKDYEKAMIVARECEIKYFLAVGERSTFLIEIEAEINRQKRLKQIQEAYRKCTK